MSEASPSVSTVLKVDLVARLEPAEAEAHKAPPCLKCRRARAPSNSRRVSYRSGAISGQNTTVLAFNSAVLALRNARWHYGDTERRRLISPRDKPTAATSPHDAAGASSRRNIRNSCLPTPNATRAANSSWQNQKCVLPMRCRRNRPGVLARAKQGHAGRLFDTFGHNSRTQDGGDGDFLFSSLLTH
jgi:hypothetical protein